MPLPSNVDRCTGVDPFLKTSGLDIRADRGNGPVIQLRGANLGGWLLLEPWMTPVGDQTDDYTIRQLLSSRFGAATAAQLIETYEQSWMQAQDFDNLASFGMNVVRVPISYFNVQNADGTLRGDAFKRLDWLVDEAWKRCIYVILDYHGAWGSASEWASSGKEGPAELWTQEENKQRSDTFWRALAEHYKGNPAVAGYDLINEPAGAATDKDRWDLQDRFFKVVRKADPDHMVFVEAIWWLDNLPKPSDYGWTNVVYECHHYDWNNQDNSDAQKAGADSKVQDFKNHAAYNVPLFMGEFNFFYNPDAWVYGAEQFSNAGMSWTTWSYRSNSGGGVNDSWGLFNPADPAPRVPNLQTDSADDISSAWSRWNAAAFARNLMLTKALAGPVLVADTHEMKAGAVLKVPAPGVLANDTQLNQDQTLTAKVVTQPEHGKLVLNGDGGFTYTPEANFHGIDWFTYTASDGRLSAPGPRPVSITIR